MLDIVQQQNYVSILPIAPKKEAAFGLQLKNSKSLSSFISKGQKQKDSMSVLMVEMDGVSEMQFLLSCEIWDCFKLYKNTIGSY